MIVLRHYSQREKEKWIYISITTILDRHYSTLSNLYTHNHYQSSKFHTRNTLLSACSRAASAPASPTLPLHTRISISTTQAYDDYVYYKTTQHLAQIYLASFPGPDNVGSNTCFHPSLKTLIEGHYSSFPDDHIGLVQNLNSTLNYRLLNKQVTTCLKDYLGLWLPRCQCCRYAWYKGQIGQEMLSAVWRYLFENL